MRCFVGIELDAITREALVQVGAAVRASDAGWAGEKWVPAENLHVTVAFLGTVDDAAVDGLAQAIGDQLADVERFSLPFAALRVIPNTRRASMLWAGYHDPDGNGTALERRIAKACAPFGVTLEERPFKAHVTLVRTRRPRTVNEQFRAALEAAASGVPEFLSVPSATLLSSTLTKAEPVYRPLQRWTFHALEGCS